jgi:hypothetical protein
VLDWSLAECLAGAGVEKAQAANFWRLIGPAAEWSGECMPRLKCSPPIPIVLHVRKSAGLSRSAGMAGIELFDRGLWDAPRTRGDGAG